MRWSVLCFLLSSILGNAQEHVRLFDEPTRMWSSWHGGTVDAICNDNWLTTYWLTTDTTVNDTTYTRVASRTHYDQSYISGFPNTCTASDEYPGSTHLVREVERRVFIRFPNGQERLLYDFTAQVGDSIPYPSEDPMGYVSVHTWWARVIAIDSVEVHDGYRKRFVVDSLSWLDDMGFVIEGIGGARGPFQPLFGQHGLSHFVGLACVAEHGEVIYGDTNCSFITSLPDPYVVPSIRISPNPSTGLFTIAEVNTALVMEVYDARGAQVQRSFGQHIDLSNGPSGLYHLRLFSPQGRIVGTERLIVQR